MKNLLHLFSSLIVITFISCDNSTGNEKESVENNISILDTSELTFDPVNESYQDTEPEEKKEGDTFTKIQFKDLTLTISRLMVWDKDQELTEIRDDTIQLYIELGETIEGQLLTVDSDELTDIQAEQSYETSVTIMNEGPHCDLVDWKHYHSGWKMLRKNENGQFICERYEQNDRKKFPEINTDELKEAVRTHCDERWYELVQDLESPLEYPSDVSISRYFLRVSGINSTGQKISRYVILEVPMGC